MKPKPKPKPKVKEETREIKLGKIFEVYMLIYALNISALTICLYCGCYAIAEISN